MEQSVESIFLTALLAVLIPACGFKCLRFVQFLIIVLLVLHWIAARLQRDL
jgi:hypothetical protein